MNGKDNEKIQKLIERFDSPVPRYTSYPTALEWSEEFNAQLFWNAIKSREQKAPLSVYVHLPFCENQCLYCGCNTVISRQKNIIDDYMDYLLSELAYYGETIGKGITVEQLHFGGGTPNFLRIEDWQKLLDSLREIFSFSRDIEQSIELDPMVLSPDYLEYLFNEGFNRISFGIQDVTPQVLRAVNRPQDIEHLDALISHARKLGFVSVNLDFIYGLPHQTMESYTENFSFIRKHRPDRLAFFSYAHIPWMKSNQKKMDETALPGPEEKLRIYLRVREELLSDGYVQIGMDHFALPGDELSKALASHALHRNFMGYTTKPELDLLGLGASAISQINRVFAQNPVKYNRYKKAIEGEEPRFEKGYGKNEEDEMRSEIIRSIMGSFFFSISGFENKWKVSFKERFAAEMSALQKFAADDLLIINDDSILLTENGTFGVRHIAKVFDAYRNRNAKTGFSRGI